MNDLAAIVTAAGASRRMGNYGHKALLPWQGTTLVAHQVRILDELGFETIVVVTGARSKAVHDATPDSARRVHNADWRSGRSSSIGRGAEAIPDEPRAILVVAVDQPLSIRVVEALLPEAGAPVVQPVDEQSQRGHPVILGGRQLEALCDIEEEPKGLRSLVRRLRPAGTLVPVESLPHWDLNTPRDYEAARASCRPGRAGKPCHFAGSAD